MDEDLKELDAMFAEIGGNEKLEENSNNFENVPDGEYQAEIIAAEYTKSKADVPMIKVEFGLADVESHVWDYLMLGDKNGDYKQSATNISRTITKLRQLGLDATTISGYVEQLNKLEGKRLTLVLSTGKSGFQNKSYLPAED